MTDGACAVNCFVCAGCGGYNARMRPGHLIFLCISLLTLSGCFPLSVYYREGASVARMENDRTDCRVEALAKVPVAMRTRYIPPVYDTRTICTATGYCTSQRILISPGRWESYDVNEGLRNEVTTQCMERKGYARVRVPACSPQVIEQTTISATRVFPPLSDRSCAIRIRGDRYQIVTPG